jgi:acyl carrier protein
MTRDEMFAKVRDTVVAQLGVSLEEVTENASFSNDLGADSLDSVELIMSLEELGTEIPDADAETLKTVGQAVDYLMAHAK